MKIFDDIKAALEAQATLGAATKQPVAPEKLATVWQELADLTMGIEVHDWRFRAILDLLAACDKAFEYGNWADFERLAERVKTLCHKKKTHGR